jgi:hypothetical protein
LHAQDVAIAREGRACSGPSAMSGSENFRRAVETRILPGHPPVVQMPTRLNQGAAALLILGFSLLLWSLIGTAIGWFWG